MPHRDFQSLHSCSLLSAFLGDLVESAAIAVEHRTHSEWSPVLLADKVDLPSFKFDQKRAPMMFCLRDKCPTHPREGIQNDRMRVRGLRIAFSMRATGLVEGWKGIAFGRGISHTVS